LLLSRGTTKAIVPSNAYKANWDNIKSFDSALWAVSLYSIDAADDWTASFTAPTASIGCSSSTVYTYLWNFGDGNTSIIQNPSHTYLSPGTYIVTLQIIGTCSTVTLTKSINIVNGTNVSIYTN
jgi:PKD repeat protein